MEKLIVTWACIAFIGLAAAAPTSELLGGVCANVRVFLNPERIKQLAEENERTANSEAAESICPQRYRASIDSLNQLVLGGSDDICSMEKARAIAAFFERHILDQDNKAPTAVGMYYISYGLKVSKACRRRMVKLIAETPKLLSGEEQEELGRWTNETSVMSHLFSEPHDYDDLVLPQSLAKFLRTRPEKIFMETATGERVKRLQALCARRWRPIYEPLILPLITLSEVGFNFRDEKEARDTDVNRLVYRWYRAVFLCETLANMVLLDDPNKSAASDRSLVRILTQQEVDELPNKEELLAGLADSLPEIEPLAYSAPREHDAQVSEPVVDINNQLLVDAVRNFKTTRAGESNFLRKLLAQVRAKIRNGMIRLASSASTSTSPKIVDSNQLIKFLDEYEYRLSTTGESAVAARDSTWLELKVLLVLFFIFLGLSLIAPTIYLLCGGNPMDAYFIWKMFG